MAERLHYSCQLGAHEELVFLSFNDEMPWRAFYEKYHARVWRAVWAR